MENNLDSTYLEPLQSDYKSSVSKESGLVSCMARVGLLEDNHRISKLCATMLSYAGHEVIIYTNASECLQALSLLDSPPLAPLSSSETTAAQVLPIDVLILDLHLPTMSGLEVLYLLRGSSRTCSLPLIFCTAATNSEINLARTIAPGALLVEKPFRLQTLISAIAEILPASLRQI